jgi:predicted nucleotide-binding protein (sugar kinase/HSP70/actin superfamily)
MYEAEYRLGVQNAGFDGFRILLFQQDDGINAASGEAGLKFTVDFGLGAFNALNIGDVLNDVCYQIRPYEVTRGETDRAFRDTMQQLEAAFRDRRMFEILERTPPAVSKWIACA